MKVSSFQLASRRRTGPTKVLDWLFIGGENDIDECLYGRLVTAEDLQNSFLPNQPQVDLWIDFRSLSINNRVLIPPMNIVYAHFPFQDGDLKSATKIFPLAKLLLDQAKSEGKKVLINCHQGASRSATLALWAMAEEMGYEQAWNELRRLRSCFAPHENFEPFIQKQIAHL